MLLLCLSGVHSFSGQPALCEHWSFSVQSFSGQPASCERWSFCVQSLSSQPALCERWSFSVHSFFYQPALPEQCVRCRHLHQVVRMPLHTPNMVNMMMQTQPAAASQLQGQQQQQPVSAAITAQLGTTEDLIHHTQQLGEILLPQHSRHTHCLA